MSRGTLAVLLGLVPVVRALNEGYEAAVELARLVRPGQTTAELGGWQLGAFLGWSIGLGAVGTHRAAGSRVCEPERTEGVVYLGPVTLTATRERLPEVAPLVGEAA